MSLPAVTKGCLMKPWGAPVTSTHWMGRATTPSNVTPGICMVEISSATSTCRLACSHVHISTAWLAVNFLRFSCTSWLLREIGGEANSSGAQGVSVRNKADHNCWHNGIPGFPQRNPYPGKVGNLFTVLEDWFLHSNPFPTAGQGRGRKGKGEARGGC